jgi:hypothetical protein
MRRLYDLDPAEVSLVSKGANKKKFLIFKSRNNEVDMATDKQKELLELVRKADPKVMKKVEKVLKDNQELQGDEGGLSTRAQAALKAVVRILTPFKEEINDDILDQTLGAAGFGVMEDEGGAPEDAGSPMEGEAGEKEAMCKEEDLMGAKDAANKAYKAHLAKMGYQKYPPAEMQMKSVQKDIDGDEAEDEDEEEESVGKSAVMKADGTLDLSAVPASVRPALEAIYKGNLELVKKNADLEKQLKEERDQRKTKEFVEKAAGFKNLGADKAELATVLKSLAETNPEAYEKIEKTLQAADTQIGKGTLFGEIGSSQSAKGGSNWDMIEKAAEGWVAKSGQNMTKAQAVEAFLVTKDGQKMYGEYKNERGGI